MSRLPARTPKRPAASPTLEGMLPLPEALVRREMIGMHLMLAALRKQAAAPEYLVAIARVIVCASHLLDAGFGEARLEGLAAAHDALERNWRTAITSGVWGIDEATFTLFADLLCLYEAQLRDAPARAVALAMETRAPSRADNTRTLSRAA